MPGRTMTRRSRSRSYSSGGPIHRPVLAVDAAQGCGAALVLPRDSLSQRPRLRGVWSWRSQGYETWASAMASCIKEALDLCEQSAQPAPLFIVERAAGATRYKTRGPDVFQGLGRCQGLALSEWRHQRPSQSRVGLLVRQSWWVDALGLARGKSDNGDHRIAEARLYVSGAAEMLRTIPHELRVDVAEAALMGASVTLHGGDL